MRSTNARFTYLLILMDLQYVETVVLRSLSQRKVTTTLVWILLLLSTSVSQCILHLVVHLNIWLFIAAEIFRRILELHDYNSPQPDRKKTLTLILANDYEEKT